MICLQLSFMVALVLQCIDAQAIRNGNTNSEGRMKCYNEQSEPIRCVPGFVNAAFRREVKSNNTCGTPATKYCVQTLSTGQREECQYCDSRSNATSHPAILITDVKDDRNYSWWQSDTLYTFLRNNIYDRTNRFSKVVLTLDLNKAFDIVSIRLRFRSLRPESMAIFKKTTADDNAPWIPYQYYSTSCQETYGIQPDQLIIDDSNLQTALCTAKYSQIVPIFGGEVLFRTLKNRPGKNNIEKLPELQEWILATSLKFELDRLNTFADDIFGDPNVLRSYYYAIIDLSVLGKCHCNGHASICKPRNGNNYFCECEHNTTGIDCEKCLPTHNNKPWGRATSENAFACEACECNGLAETCEFEAELYERTGKGGRCINCRNNTGGPHCERCRVNYHREQDHEDCQACNCNPTGSLSLQCYKDGRCYCKPGVTGDKCDRCEPNHYGFSSDGCSPCECSVKGTRLDNFQCDDNGQCNCKKNVVGKNCDTCLDGHFALEKDNPDGCRHCFCYGHSSDCKSAAGYSSVNLTSTFRTGFEGWRAFNSGGEDLTATLGTWNAGEQSVGVTSINQDSLFLTAPLPYLKKKRSSYSRILSFRFKVASAENMQFTKGDIMLISRSRDGLMVSTSLTGQGNPVPTREFQLYQYRLHEDPSFDWGPQLNGFNFQRLLNHLDEIKIRMTYSDQGTGIVDDISLEYATKDTNAVDFVGWVEECTCPPPYVGLSCGACREGHKHEIVNGSAYDRCVRCECNQHADSCDADTGKCDCLHNTVGDDCSICKDGFYGNPTAGTPDDCKPCPCKYGTKCIEIGGKVTCTVCDEGHQGELCESCVDGYFAAPGDPCRKCNCNGNIDANAVQNCDSISGDCLKCIYNTRNGPKNQCELCKVGYYGDALTYPKPGCKACDCHENGTYSSSLNIVDGTPLPCDQSGQCTCRENVVGLKCDQCLENYWNINSGDGCEACACHSTGAYNDSCDMFSGQCVCKPGVGGRRCDQCLPDHYQFSPEGCRACNCDPNGSLGVSCDEVGRCVCRPGVLGIKCDQCGENRFNLSAGCTRCPPCYDELQIKVNKLRAFLKALNESSENITHGSADANPDKEFLKRLNIVKNELHLLLLRAENISEADQELMRRLDAVNQTLNVIDEKLKNSETKTTEADVNAKTASSEVKLAEESIERSWKLVDEIRGPTNRTSEIINEIYKISSNWNKTIINIWETVNKIQNNSEDQQREVEELRKKALVALNASTLANREMEDILLDQKNTEAKLMFIDNTIGELKALADDVYDNSSKSQSAASSTLQKAEELLDEASKPLAFVNVNETKAKAATSTNEAKELQDEARSLKGNTNLQNISDAELTKRVKKLYRIENVTSDLLNQVKQANRTADEAIVNGTKTLELAKENLILLENFNKEVNESMTRADKAKGNLVEIRRLISLANNNTAKANDEIDDARKLVGDAENIAKSGSETSSKTNDDAEKLKREVDSFVVPDANIYEDVKNAEKMIEKYEERVKNQSRLVENAKKTANESKMNAQSVKDSIKKVRSSIIEVESKIADLGDLDWDRLYELEKAIAEQEKMERDLKEKVAFLEVDKTRIDRQIKSYYIDLSELNEALVELTKNHGKLHGTCLKEVPDPN